MTSSPPKLTYESKTYLTCSTSTPSLILPSSSDSDLDSPTSSSSGSHSQDSSNSSTGSSLLSSLTYVGPVGSLPNDHIFSLPVPTQTPLPDDVQEVKRWLENAEGVRNVEVMVPRKRSKGTFEV
ncbi:hypothetical protein RQP46_005154 [Phenoliferia psychrophenolica]